MLAINGNCSIGGHSGVVDDRVWRTILEPVYLELLAEGERG